MPPYTPAYLRTFFSFVFSTIAAATPVPVEGNINTPGAYELTANFNGTITINAADVSLTLQTYTLAGRLIINGKNAQVTQSSGGKIECPAAINNPEAEDAAVHIAATATNAELHDVVITCLGSVEFLSYHFYLQ